MKGNLKKISISIVFISTIIQLIAIVYHWNATQYSDAAAYSRIAEECYSQGTWYPSVNNIHDNYIWSIGYINWLILQIKVFGSIEFNPIFNLLFSFGILFNIFYISKKLFSEKVAYISIALYSILYSNIVILTPALTEIPYLFFALSAFSLCLRPSFVSLFIAGILFVIANSIRPLVLIFFVASVIYLIIFYRLKLKYYLSLIVSIIFSICVIGNWTMKNTGHFLYQSTTGGYNLMMVANDEATGGVINVFGQNQVGWIENADMLTYKEKDKIWKERSINWIIDNPDKYFFKYLQRVVALYIEDSWSDRYYTKKATLGTVLKENGLTTDLFIKDIVPRILKSAFYYIVLILGICSLLKMKKDDWKSPKVVLLLLFVMGSCATCLFPAGARYHHPYLFIIVLWAAWFIEQYITKKSLKNNIN